MLPATVPFFPVQFPVASKGTDLWSSVAQVYGDAVQDSSRELWTSSARIIQEHATRAWINASQACMQDLARNAAEVQQRSAAQMATAGRQVAELIGNEYRTKFAAFWFPGAR